MNAPAVLPLPFSLASLPPVFPDEPVLPLSVDAYHALVRAGFLNSGDPVELLEGSLVKKMTRGPRHEWARRRLLRLLQAIVPSGYFVDSQGAATLVQSEPEPDVFVLRGTEDDYADRHAGPSEVLLVVEVADSSLRRDRDWKRRIYAGAGIPVYWIVNLVDECVEVSSQPRIVSGQPCYGDTAEYRNGDSIPVVIEGNEVGRIVASELLEPPAK